jgi:hypothetical protein
VGERARRTVFAVFDGALAIGTGVVAATGGAQAAVAAAPGAASGSTSTGWATARAPLPAGPDAPAADATVQLVDESCSSSVTCVAVGVYQDVTGQDRGLLETGDGGSWAASEPPLPFNGAADSPSYLDSVSCAMGSWCKVAGVYQDVSRGTDVVIDVLSGGQWTAEEAPLPADAATGAVADSFLKSIDCTGVGSCTAVGSYKEASGGTAGFIDTLAGGHWSSQTAPQPVGASDREDVHLMQVSCPTVGACAASGFYTNDSGNDQALLLAQDADGAWTARNAPLPAGAATGDGETSESFGVSCDGGSCEAVGQYADGRGVQRGLLEQWHGGGWTAMEAPVPAAAGASPGRAASLSAVSCTFDGCVAVGDYEDASGGQRALIDTVSPAGAATATDGPQPADRAATSDASLATVSCLSVASCTAAGSYQRAGPAGRTAALLDTSAVGTWNAEPARLPAGAATESGASTLDAVACVARGACAAAGDYEVRRGQFGLLQAYTPAQGYWTDATDGGVFAFGRARFHGSGAGGTLNQEVVGMAATPDGGGYWEVAKDGGVFAFGDARFHGSAAGLALGAPIVGMAATPSGNGYWLVAADGGVFTFGDAQFFGAPSGVLAHPITGVAATPDGHGYWLVASDGGVFAYGDASFYGSPSRALLNGPVLGIAATPTGNGYWVVASDGGVFAYGDARSHGSAAALRLNKAVIGLLPTLDGGGYWLVSSDGGIFGYGDATYLGSAGGDTSGAPTVGGAPA